MNKPCSLFLIRATLKKVSTSISERRSRGRLGYPSVATFALRELNLYRSSPGSCCIECNSAPRALLDTVRPKRCYRFFFSSRYNFAGFCQVNRHNIRKPRHLGYFPIIRACRPRYIYGVTPYFPTRR